MLITVERVRKEKLSSFGTNLLIVNSHSSEIYEIISPSGPNGVVLSAHKGGADRASWPNAFALTAEVMHLVAK